MRLAVLPGVFAPISDSRLLAACLTRELGPGDRRVLDVFTGSGLLALTAARAGAPHVTAIDVSRRAVLGVRLNARLNGVRVRALRGDALAPVAGERFDVIVANPPYVPVAPARAPARGRARAWDAGEDGRALLDPLLARAPALLAGGGRLLVVHSSLCGEQRTLDALGAGGLESQVLVRARGPLGPLMRARAAHLRRRGLLARDEREEEEDVLVLCGRRPQRPATVRARGARAGHQDAAHTQGVRS